MNEEPIEEVYFNWLYSKVAPFDVPTPSNSFVNLLRILHTTEFVWTNPFDENRAEEGLELRHEFLKQAHVLYTQEWLYLGCSVLEMLIPLARRAEEQTDIPALEWFWIFMRNLKLDELNDAHPGIARKVDRVLDRFIWRLYRRDGTGGLFPLERPEEDQRGVEIWYQFCAYLAELEEDGRL